MVAQQENGTLVTLSDELFVVELDGANQSPRYVFAKPSHVRSLSGLEIIESFDCCTSDEAQRLVNRGRAVTIHGDGAALVVNGQVVLVIGGEAGCDDVDAILERLAQ